MLATKLVLTTPAARSSGLRRSVGSHVGLPPRRSLLITKAIQEQDSQQRSIVNGAANLFEEMRGSLEGLGRYDWLSAGLGALAVTTFCVANGQDATTALYITAASTIVALLLNDTLFNDK